MDLKEIEKLANGPLEMYSLGPSMALTYLSVLKDCEVHSFKEGMEVKNLGGLHVIGTSLHESRRIDNQVTVLDKTYDQTNPEVLCGTNFLFYIQLISF